MKRQKGFIRYEELLKREQNLNRMKQQGFKFVYKRNWFKVGCGVICLTIAIIPNGAGVVFYPLGFMFLGFNKMDLYRFKEIGLRKLKRFIR